MNAKGSYAWQGALVYVILGITCGAGWIWNAYFYRPPPQIIK